MLRGKGLFQPVQYRPSMECADEDYGLLLSTGRTLYHYNAATQTRRESGLHTKQPEAFVEIHPEDALEMGVSDGAEIKVVSRRGELTLKAQVRGRGTPARGSVFIPFFDESLLPNVLTLDAHCPISKQPDYKKCAVRLEKA